MRFKIFLTLKRLQQSIFQSETFRLKTLQFKTINQNSIKYLRLGFVSIAAFVWWCVFYPELCFPQDTYEAVYEMQEAAEEGLTGMDLSEESEQTGSYSLLQAEGDQIEVRSRLLEWIKQHMN